MDDKTKFDVDVEWEKCGNIWLPTKWTPPSCLEDAQEFEFRDTDVLLATYPKTGTVKKYIKHIVN